MNGHCLQRRGAALGLALGLAVLMTGCATESSCLSESSVILSNLEGRWSWRQGLRDPSAADLWQGQFVLKKDGDSYIGTLNDTGEGTDSDIIRDVTLFENQIKFTRDGRFGIQYWKGTLVEEDGVLKIVNGLWTREGYFPGLWSVEKVE